MNPRNAHTTRLLAITLFSLALTVALMVESGERITNVVDVGGPGLFFLLVFVFLYALFGRGAK